MTTLRGQAVYGASHLDVLRGGWRALEDSDHPLTLKLAVEQAQAYDAAMVNYPGFFASRRNYDIGQGIDSSGIWRSSVLEGLPQDRLPGSGYVPPPEACNRSRTA